MGFNVTDSFVLMLGHCVNLKAMRYESTSFKRILANISSAFIRRRQS